MYQHGTVVHAQLNSHSCSSYPFSRTPQTQLKLCTPPSFNMRTNYTSCTYTHGCTNSLHSWCTHNGWTQTSEWDNKIHDTYMLWTCVELPPLFPRCQCFVGIKTVVIRTYRIQSPIWQQSLADQIRVGLWYQHPLHLIKPHLLTE